MMHEKITYCLDSIDKVIDKIIGILPSYSILVFSGALGTGKTTIIRALLRRLGIKEPITSPTFTYLQIYRDKKDHTFYHFDLYRIKQLSDFFEAGFEEYLYAPSCWSFIEWPEVIEGILPKDKTCWISIDYDKDRQNCRLLTFEGKN